MTKTKSPFRPMTLGTPLLLATLFMAGPAMAQTSMKRNSGIPQHLLNKVLKKKHQKETLKKEESKKSKVRIAFSIKNLDSQFASWGVEPTNTKSSINLIPAWKVFKKKKEIIVAVIDTGIDPNHPYLKSNIIAKEGSTSEKNYGIDFSKNRISKTQPIDSHGHGTHVSGIIKSVYPNVKLLPLKYYNPQASGQDNLNSTIAALKYAVDQNVDIINYSGGGPEPALEELKILKEAEKKGILIVAAAGNEESNIDVKSNAYYPASYGLKNIITVTAHDKNLQMLNSSNWGKSSVDISAPGYRIRSAFPNGRSGFLTGTSQATAFVSGSAALLMSQYPELGTEEIKAILKRSAKKEVTLTSKCASGGRLDAGKAQIFAAQYIKAKKSRVLATKREVAGVRSKKKAIKRKNQKTQGKITYRRLRSR